jgi:hypothetical protein
MKHAGPSSIDQGGGKRRAEAMSRHGIIESHGTEICDHISVRACLDRSPLDIGRSHKACEHQPRVRHKATVTAGPFQLLQMPDFFVG